MAGVPSRTLEDYSQFLIDILSKPTSDVRVIIRGDKVVGYLLSWIRDGVRMFGYWIGRAYWGQGIASEAVRLFLIDHFPRPLNADLLSTNLGSKRVIEKSGFRFVTEKPLGETDILLQYRLD